MLMMSEGVFVIAMIHTAGLVTHTRVAKLANVRQKVDITANIVQSDVAKFVSVDVDAKFVNFPAVLSYQTCLIVSRDWLAANVHAPNIVEISLNAHLPKND